MRKEYKFAYFIIDIINFSSRHCLRDNKRNKLSYVRTYSFSFLEAIEAKLDKLD